jgi:hypothetical protein
MIRMATIAATAICLASGALALTPVTECAGDAFGMPGEIGGYSPAPAGQGFVWYTAVELATDAWLSIVEYCPEQQQLVLRQGMPGEDQAVADAAALRFQDMVFLSRSFTMREMEQELRAMGANPEMRRVGYVSCACSTN